MPTCLVAWELGGGLGHVTIVRPVVEALLTDGCRVFAAVQDIGDALEITLSAIEFAKPVSGGAQLDGDFTNPTSLS